MNVGINDNPYFKHGCQTIFCLSS